VIINTLSRWRFDTRRSQH